MIHTRTFTARNEDDALKIVDAITAYLWIKPQWNDNGHSYTVDYVPADRPSAEGLFVLIDSEHTVTLYFNPQRTQLPIAELCAHVLAYAPVKGY